MKKLFLAITTFVLLLTISSCSKRNHPSASDPVTGTKPAETTPVRPATVKTAVPKVIVVNDAAAKKSVDGRYYYDLDGHRYWRNNRDGKYYLFHKSMFDNPDFKSPAKQ